MKDLREERLEAANRLRWMVPEYGAYPLGEIGTAVMGGSFAVSELRDRLIWLLGGDADTDGKTPVEDANGTAGAATDGETGIPAHDSREKLERDVRAMLTRLRLTYDEMTTAAVDETERTIVGWLDRQAHITEQRMVDYGGYDSAERIRLLQAALDEQGDELARVKREIERDYMRLPEIADGVVRFGDCIEKCGVCIGPIDCISYGVEGDVLVYENGNSWEVDSDETHYHAPTVEDVLREFRFKASCIYDDPNIGGEDRADALYALDDEYAEKLREVLRDE